MFFFLDIPFALTPTTPPLVFYMIQLLDMSVTNAPKIHFLLHDNTFNAPQRAQFHIVGTKDFLSAKSRGKRPANVLVGMNVSGEGLRRASHYTTSAVKCKSSADPEWFDNLGPMWITPSVQISFQVKGRSAFSKTTTVLARTDTYTFGKLRSMQGQTDRKSTIELPLRSETGTPTDGVIIVNVRELSTAGSAMDERLVVPSSPKSTLVGDFEDKGLLSPQYSRDDRPA